MRRLTARAELPLDPACLGLVREVLARGGHLRVRAVGLSMLPAIAPGDVLTLGPLAPGGARVGEVVIWARAGGVRAHRVVAAGPDGVTTRGDALAQPDPPVAPDAVLGRVVAVRRPWRGRLRAWLA